MDQLKALLTTKTKISVDMSAGAEMLAGFRKEFPQTASFVLDGISKETKLKLREDVIKEYNLHHIFLEDITPIIGVLFQKAKEHYAETKYDHLKTYSAFAKEMCGLICSLALYMDWVTQQKEITTFLPEGPGADMIKMLVDAMPEEERKYICSSSWLAINYSDWGPFTVIMQHMLTEKHPGAGKSGFAVGN